MLKFAVSITVAIGFTVGLTGVGAPADAQSNRRGQVVVYGDDPCPRQADDEVLVCVRRPATERYRIPEAYRPSGDRQERQSWVAQQQDLRTVGATGIGTCSNVGPAYYTGCLVQQIRRADAEREEAEASDTPPGR
jgi:hypothetical protein